MLKDTARVTPGAVAAAIAGAPAAASPGILTDAHQAEHEQHAAAVAAEQERLAALSPAERDQLEARADAVTQSALAVPAEQGRLWAPPFPHRSYGMHAALLPTGKVLCWSLPIKGYDFTRDNEGLAWLWDPARGTGARAFENVGPPL